MNLALTLLYAAERAPDREAFVGEGTRVTYADLHTAAAGIAAGLAARGVDVGDRVACVLANEPETVNADPYGEGWLVRIRLTEPSEADSLLDVDAYKQVVAES